MPLPVQTVRGERILHSHQSGRIEFQTVSKCNLNLYHPFHPSQTSDWFGAVAYCHSVGMELTEVLNEDEARAMGEVIAEEESDSDDEFYWIGANDLGVQGTYRWALTGRPVLYSQWAAGEPNHARGENGQQPAERCVAVAMDKYEWNDFQCTQQKSFICQQFRKH